MTTFLATRAQRGMAVFLVADFVVFLALFVSYIYLRVHVPVWPAAFHFASGLMAFAITLFAFSGSFAMVYSAKYQVKEGYEIAMRLIVATIAVLGSVIILLGMEWVRLIFIADVTFTHNSYGVPAFSWTYFTLTGFYGLHLLVGLIYLSVVAVRIKSGDAGAAALYVHFTNLVWLILFIGVYLASSDLQGL
jgi:heme/copper-type cytochrome/quinol oxidase subunit 3